MGKEDTVRAKGEWPARVDQQVAMDYVIVGTAAQALRDRELMVPIAAGQDETERLIAWLNTQVKEIAPQVLAVR